MTRAAHLAAVRELEAAADGLVFDALSSVLARVAGGLAAVTAAADDAPADPLISVDDTARLPVEWTLEIDGRLLPWYREVYDAGAGAALEQVAEMRRPADLLPEVADDVADDMPGDMPADERAELLARRADPELIDPEDVADGPELDRRAPFVIDTDRDPLLLNDSATRHLAGARNRFLEVGDDIWSDAREALLDGMARGDGIEAMRRRFEQVVDVGRAKASAIARTEVISAANAGSTAQVRAMGAAAPNYKQWLSTMDGRTRPTHRHADGQVVELSAKFAVGSDSLDYPGDPEGANREVINCRCTVLYVDDPAGEDLGAVPGRQRGGVDEETGEIAPAASVVTAAAVPAPDQVDSTTGEPFTTGMVALIPSDADLERLAGVGEPVEALHLTLLYLGESADMPEAVAAGFLEAAEQTTATMPVLVAEAFGAAVWNPYGDSPSLVLNIGGEGLTAARDWTYDLAVDAVQAAAEATEDGLPGWELPAQHVPWVAHVCLAYADDPGILMPEALARLGPIRFDRMRVALGGEAYDFPLLDTSVEMSGAGIQTDVATGGPEMTDPANPEEVIEPLPGEHFHAIGHVQGVSTGRRTFTNTEWRSPPFAFHWQRSSSAHGGTPEVLQAGLVTRVVVAGPTMHMFGPLDIAGPVGAEYARQLVTGFARWVSIGLDEQPVKVTYVWPDGTEGDDPLASFEEPSQIIFDGGTIGELTGTSIPAQADATIEATPELIAAMGGTAPAEQPEPDEPEDDEEDDERPPLELAAGARPGRARPTPMLRVAASVARSGRAAGHGFADRVQALTAAAYRMEIPDLPPAEWFDEPPHDLPMEGALNVDDNGRIWGLLAPLGVNHRAYAKSYQRQEVPFGNVDYDRFNGAGALTAAGRVPAGALTMDCGHAPQWRPDGEAGPAHYDNACSIIGAVRAGESTRPGLRGVWIAGALMPGVKPDQVARMLACRCSGDWQPHGDKVGWSELIACLLVPSPGFATGGMEASYSPGGVLVASSVPVHLAEAPARAPLASVIDHIAATAGATPAARIADIAATIRED
jgi:SPP1 gp7 family putative phage head morphogenesis protein